MQLDGKLAVVTGGISGLGRATAERFAKEGARVVIADINAEKGETAAQEMSAGGAAIEFIAVNVTDESSQQALFDDVVRRYGQLDIVVAAAGISSAGYVSGEVSTPAEDPEDNFLFNKPIADWQRVLDVNLTGVAITDRLAARHMLALGTSGSIINIASIDGIRVNPWETYSYQASKAAVIQLTKRMATRLIKDSINVTGIAPGAFASEMNKAARDFGDAVGNGVPSGRIGRDEDMAAVAIYLAARSGDYVVGETIAVDGGVVYGSAAETISP